MKFGYFFDGTQILEDGRKREDTMKAKIFLWVGAPILGLTGLFAVCGIYMIKNTSAKITRGVI